MGYTQENEMNRVIFNSKLDNSFKNGTYSACLADAVTGAI